MSYDVLVIGKGLIGSAAARYLAESGLRVAVIGPDEPADVAAHEGVFASHYDEGRITHTRARDALWSALSVRSIDRYEGLREASGVAFHHPVGCLSVRPAARAGPAGVPLRQAFPHLSFPDGWSGNLERGAAGYVNPRAMLHAQLRVAASHGAEPYRDLVVATGIEDGKVVAAAASGRRYRAQRVLVATGAFANGFDVLPRKLALRVKTEFVLLARVPDAEVARLESMPALVYELEAPALSGIYLLPPIRYPDGHHYLKMGCDTRADRNLASVEAMCAWMRGGDSDCLKDDLRAAMLEILPGLRASSFQTKRCLVTYTTHGKPYIGRVAERVFVATGGNGCSAKCADALGEIAASFTATGAWQDPLAERCFAPVFASG